jgi:redox-sensitive bicupin YhaK (pirin superfamily)
MGFGALRVLNDDIIAPGKGFQMHQHKDMEIITIVTKGELAHKDSTGSSGILTPGEVQVMSAGTGIVHSEYNSSKKEYLELFQLWIYPDRKGITPRYDQKRFDEKQYDGKLKAVASNRKDETLFINQDAAVSLGNFKKGKKIKLKIDENRGSFILVIEGSIIIEKEELKKRDSIEMTGKQDFEIMFSDDAKLLVIEIPM